MCARARPDLIVKKKRQESKKAMDYAGKEKSIKLMNEGNGRM